MCCARRLLSQDDVLEEPGTEASLWDSKAPILEIYQELWEGIWVHHSSHPQHNFLFLNVSNMGVTQCLV